VPPVGRMWVWRSCSRRTTGRPNPRLGSARQKATIHRLSPMQVRARSEIVLSCPEDIRGIAVKPDGRLLLTLLAGMAEVDLEAQGARWVQGPTWMDRNPHVDPTRQVWILRGAAVAQLDGSRLRVVAGGGTVALSDHPVRLPPLRRSKTTDHRHGRVVQPFLGALP
jgi:hypothetical protein